MSGAALEIRRLAQENTTDVALYRSIRLEALRANPEAFGSSFETENAQTLTWFGDRLGASTVLGAFLEMQLVGIAGFAVQQGEKRAHKGSLWGMYVQPSSRRLGVGRQLVEAIIELARRHVELVQLAVVRDNERARRLYTSLGFLDYGLEKNALKQDGRYYDDVLMAKALLGE